MVNKPDKDEKNAIAIAAELGTVEAPTVAIEYTRREDDLTSSVKIVIEDDETSIEFKATHSW